MGTLGIYDTQNRQAKCLQTSCVFNMNAYTVNINKSLILKVHLMYSATTITAHTM